MHLIARYVAYSKGNLMILNSINKNKTISMRFDVEKRIFFTKKLNELKSVTLVPRAYMSEYKNKNCPTKATKLNLFRKFDRTGSLLDLAPKPKNERETRIEARIRLKILFTEDPSLSIRKASFDVGISYSLCRDILLKDAPQAVQISKCSPVTATRLRKKSYFCSMVARLGKEHLQVVNRF